MDSQACARCGELIADVHTCSPEYQRRKAMDNEALRRKFEESYAGGNAPSYALERNGDGYKYMPTALCWQEFQKGYQAALSAQSLQPKWEGEFRSFSQWLNNAQDVLESPSHRPAICIDAIGRRCTIGKDFMRARDEDAFPIRYFWEFETIDAARAAQEKEDANNPAEN